MPAALKRAEASGTVQRKHCFLNISEVSDHPFNSIRPIGSIELDIHNFRLIFRTMVRLATNLITSIGLLLGSSATWGMEFTFDPVEAKPDKGNIVAVGEIQPGGDGKLHRLVAGLPSKTVLVGVALSSPGGDLLEGVRIATTIRNTRLVTAVADVCASACFLVFAAGLRKVASEDARVGVHSVSYRGAEVTASQWAVTATMARKAAELDVPPAIVRKLETTPADDMAWLTQDDLRSMNVELVAMRAGHEPGSPLWSAKAKASGPDAGPALLASMGPRKAGPAKDVPPPDASPAFLAGRQARVDYEAWFNGLSGDIRAGAEWWAGVRTRAQRDRLTCEAATPPWVDGCKQAQAILGPTDNRRRAEPDFRAGWNSL